MKPDDLLKFINEIDLNNLRHVIVIGIIVLSYMGHHISSLNASNIELMFMKDKDLRIRTLLVCFILCISFIMCNWILLTNTLFVLFEIILFIVAFILYILGFTSNTKLKRLSEKLHKNINQVKKYNTELKTNETIIQKFRDNIEKDQRKVEELQIQPEIHNIRIEKYNDLIIKRQKRLKKFENVKKQYQKSLSKSEKKIRKYKKDFIKKQSKKEIFNKSRMFTIQYSVVILLIPIILTFIYILKSNVSLYSLSVIGAVLETLMILLISDDLSPEYDVILSKKNKQLYVYKKINENYLLCGDKKTMSESSNITIIPLTELYEHKYSIQKTKLLEDNDNINDVLDEENVNN